MVYWGYVGDNRKENGNYCMIIRFRDLEFGGFLV